MGGWYINEITIKVTSLFLSSEYPFYEAIMKYFLYLDHLVFI